MARSNVTFAILGVFVGYVLALPYVAALQSPSYSRVVVFGDSLVDNGNGTYKLSNRTWPADSAYFDGRFSNGLTWPEQLAGLLHVAHVDDYAHGSATTDNRVAKGCSGYNSTLPVPDVRTQVHRYLAHVGHADRDALYVVSGGSNDAFFGLLSGHTPKELAHDAVATLRRETERLQRHGARHVLVPTLSEMQATPYARKYSLGVARLITAAFTREVNHGLRAWVDGGARNVTLFDVHAVEARVLAAPHKYGLENTHEACLVGTQKVEHEHGVARHECAEPNRYFFFDLYHPTEHVHALLARGAAHALASSR